MGQINAIPKGFLDLFNAQQQGKNPPEYSELLAPVVDMTELYLGATLAAYQLDSTHTGVQVETVTVPANETWLLRGVSANSNITSGTQIEFWSFTAAVFPRSTSAGGTFPPVTTLADAVCSSGAGIDSNIWVGHTFPAPIAFQAGTVMHARLLARDAGASRSTSLVWLMNVLKS